MTMNALGAFAVALIFISANLYVGGYEIYNLGYRYGAIGAWVGASVTFLLGLFISILFIRAYRKQRSRETSDDYKRETGKFDRD